MAFSYRHRKGHGQSMVELLAGLVVLIPVILTLIDLAVLVISVTVNDTVCRDAARACAAGPPAQAVQRAQAVVSKNYKPGGAITSLTVADADVTRNNVDMRVPPFGGPVPTSTPGSPPSVTVTTHMKVRPPFLTQVVAANNGGQFDFASSATYTYTYVYPNNQTPN